MEKPIASIPVQGGAVEVHTKPYEIKTIKIKYSSMPQPAAAAQP